jgi:thermostable 8-oxoguanine DNA glycosylase
MNSYVGDINSFVDRIVSGAEFKKLSRQTLQTYVSELFFCVAAAPKKVNIIY